MRYVLLILLMFSGFNSARAVTWYVSGAGKDDNDGKSLNQAFRNLQTAADVVSPGDLVLVGDGVYPSSDVSLTGAVLSIDRSGTAEAWISWRALRGTHPQIRPKGWCGIQITGSYHSIEGLDVIGANDSIVLLHALEDAKKAVPNPVFNTNGIFINGRPRSAMQKPHHVVIRNCRVGKCAGGGIIAIESDYITIEDCKVFDNAWFMRYGGSGISTLNNWAYNDAPGYHIIIQRNYVWNNKTLVPWEKIGKLSDGNGIILDVTDRKVQGATNPDGDAVAGKPKDSLKSKSDVKDAAARPEWKGRALVANNLSAFNGGSGIHTFRTRHVDIVNNTTYWNGQIVGYQELFANNSQDIVILNNIIVPRPGGKVTSNNKNSELRWDYNLYPVDQQNFSSPNDIVADPGFLSTGSDLLNGNFRLSAKSLARGSASQELAQPTDITGRSRRDKVKDRGAFAFK